MEISVYEFHLKQGRMPMADRGEKPWRYRGWLRVILQMLNAVDDRVPNRWGYFRQWFESGRVPADPIPQISWLDAPEPTAMKQLDKAVEIISAAGHGGWGAFERLLEWLAFAMDVPGPVQESTLSDATQEKLYRQLDFHSWLLHPYDYLGSYVAERSGKGWNPHAFFPTPMGVVKLMVAMTMGEGDQRMKSVNDPCCGSGRILLVASNYSLCLSGMDIDPQMVQITLINGLIWAPWIALPLAAHPATKETGKIELTAPKRKQAPPAKRKLPPPKKRKKTPPPKKRGAA